MLAPALLFIGNFIGALFSSGPAESNAVYNAAEIIATVVIDLILIGYVVFAVWASHCPIAPTLALRRPPLRRTLKLAGLALAVILVANLVLDPILNASQRQGLAPTYNRPADNRESAAPMTTPRAPRRSGSFFIVKPTERLKLNPVLPLAPRSLPV